MFKIALTAGHYKYTSGKRVMKSLDANETREWVLNDRIADKIEKIVLFRWNRHYPADAHFQFPGKWALTAREDFPGSSHEKITMEVYEKCE